MSEKENVNALASMASWGVPPPPSHAKSNNLLPMYSRIPVNNIYYNAEHLTLDGYNFNKCRFDHCTIDVYTSNFEMVNCVIDESTVITFRGDSSKLMKLFFAQMTWAYENFPDFAPIKNENGTITIIGPTS